MEEYTPKDILDIARRRKFALILPFLGIFTAAVVTACLMPSIYRSTATILIEQREISAEYVTSSITTFAEQRMQSIRQRILTSGRLLELIERFGLYPELRDKKTTDEIIELMRNDILLTPVNVEITDRRSGRTATATIAFTLSYEGRDPATVQVVANTVSSLFLQEDLKVRKDMAASAYDFLVMEKDKVQAQITALEKKLAAFKSENVNRLPELFQLNRRTLDSLETAIDRAKENRRALREKKEELEEQLSNTPRFLEAVDPDRERLQALEMEMINLRTRFSDKYPDIRRLQREIRELSEKVETDPASPGEQQKNPAYVTLSARMAGLKTDIESAGHQVRDLEKQADVFRTRLVQTPGVEERYNTLMGERTTLYTKYTDLQGKMMEASVAREFESKQKGERFTLVEAARLAEKPYKPNRLAIVLTGLVLGLGIGGGLVFLVECFDASFRNSDALSRFSGFPVLAEIPVIVTDEDRQRFRVRRSVAMAAVLVTVCLTALIVDQFIIDFQVLQAKILRNIL